MNGIIKALLIATALLLSGCATDIRSKADRLEATMLGYERAVRWGNMAEAMQFLDPTSDAAMAMKPLELERWAQFDVKGYRKQSGALVDDAGIARQAVEIELLNRHTQTPRTVLDRQEWKFDKESGQWRLISGLPMLQQSN
jgi:hypothetical protein